MVGRSVVFGGTSGVSHQKCLDYVEENWTDIRPRTLRAQVAAAEL
ncbi:MAG: hypothetical protein U5N21_06390 [Rhodococcus sp. (in: high G+C Gram-positive bacteria)]|nr:hypothetical protein [Rhodococcus sp. (in: high G+C Gram-positive bacteria)]